MLTVLLSGLFSLLRGALSSPRVLFGAAIVLGLVVGGCSIDRRATQRERAKWEAKVIAAEARARAEERAAADKIAAAARRLQQQNEDSTHAQQRDVAFLRDELARAHRIVAGCRVPRPVVLRLDAGAGALPGAAGAAGRAAARADPAVSRPGAGPAGAAGQSEPEPAIDGADILVRARELSGAAERNTERLRACLAAYDAARDAAVRASGDR